MFNAVACLPESLQDIYSIIGLDSTLALIAAFGGTKFYVSAKPSLKLAELVGAEVAKKISDHFGGQTVQVPLAKEFFRIQRDRQIYCRRIAGESSSVLAREFKMSERRIKAIYAQEKGNAAAICCQSVA